MNHGIYRLVFNNERNAWVAVAENVRGRGKKSSRRRVAAVVLGLAAVAAGSSPVWAAPPAANALPVPSSGSRPFVFAGAVTGGQPTTVGNAMTITTASRALGLNWQSFDIGSNASVTFNQPDATSRVLNRIWSNDPSQIMGRLSANGQIYLINQNGILFGNGAQVNVGGLVASALNISDSMASKLLNNGLPVSKGDSLEFAFDGSAAGFNAGFVTVEAGAAIRTPSGGRVVLIAPKTVENMGLIEGGAGAEAILAAGGKVILTAPDDPSLRGLLVETQSFTGRDSLGNSVTLDGTVTNSGQINAGTGGVVSLAALAVNQKGIVNATKAVNLNGTTILVSGSIETDRLTINQRGDVAEIDWVSGFNVGAGKTVEFVQSSAGAVAYNIVNDDDIAGIDKVKGTGWTAADGSLMNQAGRTSIDGILKANGQFVLINEKGIDFGAKAQVSASNFVASALGINPDVKISGLLMQDGVSARAFYLNKTPATDSADARDAALASFRQATVNVSAGATIDSASNGYVILAGGKVNQAGTINTPKGQTVLAAGADVYLKPAYAQAMRGFSAEVNPLYVIGADTAEMTKPWIALSRGADANAVTNSGDITAAFGNITLVGHEIFQLGTLTASTSATANGSIRLLARDQVAMNGAGDPVAIKGQRNLDNNGIAPYVKDETYDDKDKANQPEFTTGKVGGELVLGAGSKTQVLLDGSDGKTLNADQPFISSSIEAAAKHIEIAGSQGEISGAVVEAKGGRIYFRASESFDLTSAFAGDPVTPSQTSVAPSGVGIFVGDGARIDASGVVASKSAADLFTEVELRGDEFADNPVQRSGALRGQKAWVDIRDKFSIANLKSWTDKVGQTVEERSAAGGTISLGSTGSVVVKQNAELDISGGHVDYAAGTVSESRAITVSGQTYRLNDAPATAQYAGLTTVKRNVAAYSEGKSAGTVEVTGHSLALDGKFKASTTVGAKQRNIGDPTSDRYAIPLGGKLIVKDAGQHFALADPLAASEAEKMAAFTQAQIVFVKGAAGAASGLGVDDVAGPRLELSSSLVDAGFSRFDIRSDGRVDIPSNVALNLAAGGSFKVEGRQVYVAGDIAAPGGSISLATRDMSLAAESFPFPSNLDAKYSTLIVDSGATLSTAGRWVNDYQDGPASTSPKAIQGGRIELTSAYDLDLRAGSTLDVSGGGRLNTSGKLEAGNAGSIALTTGGMSKDGGFDFIRDTDRRDASLFLDGTMSGCALGSGGKLEINTSALTLGQTFTADSRNWSRADRLTAGQVGAALDDGFFNRGGFYEFKLVGRDGVNVVNGAHIAPTPVNWSLAGISNALFKPTGSAIASFAQSTVLHPDLRAAPTKLSLATRSLNFGDLVVGDGAYLGVSPQGTISLESQAQLTVLGTLEAPAGTINLTRPANRSEKPYNQDPIEFSAEKASESIYLGPDSKLLAGGVTALSAATRAALEAGASADELRSQSRYRGTVLDGGAVNINAGMGYLISRAGSLIDVAGTQDNLNTPTATSNGSLVYPVKTVGSAGGSVNLAAREGMILDGRFSAAGGRDALGGTFSLRFADAELKANPWDFLDALPPGLSEKGKAAMLGARNLTLYQSADAHSELWPSTVDAAKYLAGAASIDQEKLNGKAALDLSLLQSAGFGSWYLASQDAMRFSGNIVAKVNNQLRLDAPSFSAADDASTLSLTAAAAEIGNFNIAGAAVAAGKGNAQATIEARDIGLVGTFSWNGFGDSRFVSQGAIHFDSIENVVAHRDGGRLYNGQMSAAGRLELSAARLSPATYSDFRVDLTDDPAGSISITRPTGASADVSLSPAGRLEFAAATIDHQGTVTAPLGEIVFNSPTGSVTLGSGSETSVAADRDLLLGYTIDSGTKWKFDATRWSAGTSGVSKVVRAEYDIVQAPAKAIRIDAAHTDVASGAKLDLSGGGEAVAWEFSAGPGGKNDILQASSMTFAILPGAQGIAGWNGFSATDSGAQQYYNVTATASGYSPVPSLKAGDRISLAANPAGVSGTYVLLPARYALLPGAYLVTVKADSDSVLAGAKPQADGSWLVSGSRLAVNADGSTTAYRQRPLTVELANSSVTAKRAKYVTTTASQFFYDTAGANLAGDVGQLTAIGRSSLFFDPVVVAMRQAEIAAEDGRKRAGRGLELDLAAPKLMVSDAGAAPDSSWSLLDQDKLNALGASSLLLGGARTTDGATTRIDTIASEVMVRNTGEDNPQKALVGPEIMLAAKDVVTVADGSRIEASGAATGRSVALKGDGAFLRAAAGDQATVTREGMSTQATRGDLLLEQGATVAGQSLILDATHDNILAGTMALGTLQENGARSGGYVTIGAGRVNVVGDGTVPADGLVLNTDLLGQFSKADQVRLTSYKTLDLYGNAALGSANLKELVINAAGVAGHGSDSESAVITAKSVWFENTNPGSAIFAPGAALGSGSVSVSAETIGFGGNATKAMRTAENTGFALRGFGTVNLTASGDMRFEGSGVTAIDNIGGSGAATSVNISAARVATVGAADHLLTASGNSSIASSGGTAGSNTGLGGALEIRSKAIDVSGKIETPSGKLTLAATDDVTIRDKAIVAAEGSKVAFADTFAYAPAGQIALRSAKGNVNVETGAVVSVSAAPEAGDAGQLKLEAKEGKVSAAAGTLRATASKADKGANRGSLIVDAKSVALDNLAAAVRQTLSDGSTLVNFTGQWDIRRRLGDLALTQEIKAESVKLAADNGNIDISGRIDASGSKGGNIELYANRGQPTSGEPVSGGRIDLRAGSVLDASATESVSGGQGTAGRGGTVIVGVSASNAAEELNTAINFEAAKDGKAAALIDVSTPAGSAAAKGKVTFRAPRKDVVSGIATVNGSTVIDNALIAVQRPADYLVSPTTQVSSLGWGTTVSVRLPDNNTGQVSLNLSGLGSKTVLRADGSVLADGDLVSATTGKVLVYDGSAYRISPTANSAIPATPTVTGGTGSAYTLAGTMPAAWGVVAFKASVSSMQAPTLKIGSGVAKTLVNSNGTALAANAIAKDQLVLAVYDGVNFRLSPTTPSVARQMNVAPGTSGINYQVAEIASGTTLVPGTVVSFTAQAAAKGGAKLRVGNIAEKDLLGADGSSLGANAFGAKQRVDAVYDGTAFRLLAVTDSSMAPVTLAGNVNGAGTVALEGVRTIRNDGDLVLGTQQQATLLAGLSQALATKGATFASDADKNRNLGVVFRAGEEVRATGAITVASDWDMATARSAGQPGALTLRAEGDLNINGTLSDGFVANGTNTAVSRDAKLMTSGDSWTYRLVAGADTVAASPLEMKEAASSGSIIVAANKLIRTGTGDIDLVARRDIKLLDRAAVFTAGVAASTHPTGFTPITSGSAQSNISSVFPDGGGDLTLTAGERIVMVNTGTTLDSETAPVQRNINQWLYRNGNTGRDLQWWPRIASFQQGAATFGGGDLLLDAGSDIKNFTAFIPTNGRVPTIDGQRRSDLAVVQGGGDLTVHAGGTVDGGLFYAEVGQLRLEAAALASDVGIALGNASARVVSAGDAALGNVFNPMWATSKFVVNQGQTVVATSNSDYTSAVRIGTYGPSSALDLVSVNGKVELNASDNFFLLDDKETLRLAPSRFKVAALNGNIEGTVAQAPGENGQLDLLASGSIAFGNSAVRQLDVPSSKLPSLSNPLPGSNFELLSLMTSGTALEKHASSGWHGGDSEHSRVVAQTGNITGQAGESNFAEFSEAVRIEAGGNITDFSVVAQHARSTDVSTVTAGGNIVYNVDGGKYPSLGMALGGSGRLEVSAGGSIQLGDSRGIVTRGNLDNPYLPENGASIFAVAGATADYDAFRSYLKVGPEVGEVELRDRFYTLLRDYGRAAQAGGGEPSYEQGREVIRALFPQASIKGGDINLFASQFKTEQGGGIDLLAPGGSVVVGVADPSIKKQGSQQGLFTLRDGDIRAYVSKNFQVNSSRVFTLDGGDILVWADTGSIDAGSGAKTVSSTPPPALVIRNGQVVLDTSNSISGSGIGALASRDDTPASDMDLFAPKGAIDAGDAGLRSTGNITLGARTILNAANIQAAGSVSGAPAPVAAAAPVATMASPTSKEDRMLEESPSAAGNRNGAQGMLTVEVLGGEEHSESTRNKCAGDKACNPG